MSLSKRGDYVMRSAISLARAYDEGAPRKIREVVADTDVPQTFASQILADLVHAGLASSRAGRDGGFRLSRPPQEISILEVVEAGEGPLRAERCVLGEGPCRWHAVCPLHETWSQATVALRDLLVRTSLAEVAARDRAIDAGTYASPADTHRSNPGAVALSDVVQVELPEPGVHVALARAARELGPLAGSAAAEGAAGTDGAGARPRLQRAPAAEVSLVPVGGADGAEAGSAARYLLAWRIRGSERGCRLEADLSVTLVDVERSELRVEGTWRQDAGGAALLAAPELERQARRTLRAFLRRLAQTLEEHAKAAGVDRSPPDTPAGPARPAAATARRTRARGDAPASKRVSSRR